MYLAESSRSLATLMASFPVSFWMFCEEMFKDESTLEQNCSKP
jgi:hypothetical protein